jgi:hypothetical protein
MTRNFVCRCVDNDFVQLGFIDQTLREELNELNVKLILDNGMRYS